MWYLYVLMCRDNSLYIGITNNITRRLKEHERGTGSKFVRSRQPFTLLKAIPCGTATAARRLEHSLKRMNRKKKIEVLGLSVEPVRTRK